MIASLIRAQPSDNLPITAMWSSSFKEMFAKGTFVAPPLLSCQRLSRKKRHRSGGGQTYPITDQISFAICVGIESDAAVYLNIRVKDDLPGAGGVVNLLSMLGYVVHKMGWKTTVSSSETIEKQHSTCSSDVVRSRSLRQQLQIGRRCLVCFLRTKSLKHDVFGVVFSQQASRPEQCPARPSLVLFTYRIVWLSSTRAEIRGWSGGRSTSKWSDEIGHRDGCFVMAG